MNESRLNSMRRAARPAVVACGLIVILAVVTWATGSILATRRLSAAKERWEASIGPLARVPDTVLVDNAAAGRAVRHERWDTRSPSRRMSPQR